MFNFCVPTKSTTVPRADDWFHEVKYDGYRIRLQRDGDGVRQITRGGRNRTNRYPWIVEAAPQNPHGRLPYCGRPFACDGRQVRIFTGIPVT